MATTDIKTYLLEFDTYDDTTAGVITERFSTGKGFITKKSETPSLAKYLPLINDAGSIQEFLFGKGRTTGFTVSSIGKIVLNNVSGRISYLRTRGIDGRTIRIREKTGSNYPADFPIRFEGVVEALSDTNQTITLDVRSSFFTIKQQVYQPIKYAGTNNGSSIFLEGTIDLEGAPKPKVLGDCSNANMPAVLVDRANDIYQLSSDPIDSIQNVYTGRSNITAGVAYTDLATFVTAVTGGTPVLAGKYDYYLGDSSFAEGINGRGCYIALGTTPSKRVTFNAKEGWKNLALQSEVYSNAAWVATTMTIADDTDTAPDNNVVADTLTATGANSTLLQTVTIASASYIYSVWLKRKTGTGNVDITVDGGITWETKTLNVSSYTRVEVSPQTVSNPQFGVRIVTNGDEVYAFGSQCEKQTFVGPYTATTTVSIFNHAAMSNVWKIMNQRGFTLDADSIAQTNSDDSSVTGDFKGTNEVSIVKVFDKFTQSIKAFLSDTVSGKFICGVFKIPTAGEVSLTVDDRALLGTPKIKFLRQADLGRGIPIYRSIVRYNENFTVMSEADVFGVAELTDIPFVSEKWRSVLNETSATKTKHLDSTERILDTALTVKADANTRGVYELTLYDQIRFMVEIRIPFKFGFALSRNDVIRVDGALYRIVNKTTKFPKGGSNVGETSNAIIIQAWGGISG